jgi:predicted sulfurtransferase
MAAVEPLANSHNRDKMEDSILEQSRNISVRFGIALLVLLIALSACQASPQDQDAAPRIAPSVLKERLDDGDGLLVVDARSSDAYAEAHIPGAISVPLSDLEARMDELPRDQEIVFYCT